MARVPYEDLPEPVRAALAARVGNDHPGIPVDQGDSAALANWFWPKPGSSMVFVKGLPLDHERIGELRAEAAVNPFLPDCAPRLLWQEEAGGWLLLCFEGLQASLWTGFGKDSAHLGAVAAVLEELSRTPAPEVVTRTPWDRWGRYCDPADEPLLVGDRLAHSDPASTNFMTESSGRVHLIDWAWAMRGPAWLDTALWGFRLVMDGRQSVEQAAGWAAKVPAFAAAPRRAVAVLTEAEARSWEDWQASGTTELERTVAAARAWAAFWAAPPV
ncbi:aminoglycoside phosphotransferase [Streptomyces sp. NPDC097619]|uniref:aminoglycoside phosphotransferase n=1 Tax=Streptomyces sp. NPDC097619 TaxID=3157228 RepID=UPI003319C36A